MKAIKAFVHRNRIADVMHALEKAGFNRLSAIDVRGMLKAMDEKERNYSVELGESVITEVKLELVCENDSRAAEAIDIIRTQADTGQPDAGWIYVSEIQSALRIGKM